MIKVILRFDDPSSASNHQLEKQIIDCLGSNKAKATFAVIPFIRSENQHNYSDTSWASHLIKGQLSGITEIALHGFSHKKRGCTPQGSPTEFAGIAANIQEKMIREGVVHLRAIFGEKSVTGFIPPWNSYDINTLQALKNQKFKYLSAGRVHPGKCKSSLMLVPRTCQFFDIKEAVNEARHYARLKPKVITVMHHYDFTESGTNTARLSLRKFSELLAWLGSQPDISLHTLGELAETAPPQAYMKNLHWQLPKTQCHYRIQKYLPKHCIVDASLWRACVAGMMTARSGQRHVSR